MYHVIRSFRNRLESRENRYSLCSLVARSIDDDDSASPSMHMNQDKGKSSSFLISLVPVQSTRPFNQIVSRIYRFSMWIHLTSLKRWVN